MERPNEQAGARARGTAAHDAGDGPMSRWLALKWHRHAKTSGADVRGGSARKKHMEHQQRRSWGARSQHRRTQRTMHKISQGNVSYKERPKNRPNKMHI